MQRLRALLSITSVRLSIVYTVIFGFVAMVIVVYMTGSTVGILRRQIQESVNIEIVEMLGIYDREGINGVLGVMEQRAASPGANLYVLSEPAGSLIAANIKELDQGVISREGWISRPFEYTRFQGSDDRRYQAIGRVTKLPNGMRLMIGRDLGEPERFRQVVAKAWFLSIAATVLLGLATWFFVGRQALRRLDMVSRSTARIMAGDRSERLPVTGSNDEFDRLSERLNVMLDRLNLLDEGLRQVSDNIAHDLKTPLTRLRNKADSALAAASPQMRSKRLKEIIADTDQIIRTFDALLMISRVEAGSAVAELTRTDLSTLVSDVGELYEPVAEDGGFAFSATVEPGIAVRGNRELLSQALSNLADNALKFAGSRNGNPRMAICLERRGKDALISVADNGPGIAEADRKRVTERFTRLEESRSVPGNGLGLSLVRAVALLHGGRLEFFDNQPGLKACLSLPVAAETDA